MKLNDVMSKYKGLFTFDVDNHRYLPVEQADGIIDCMNYHSELEMPKEPLIKDEKIRTIFKMWADNFKNAMIDGTITFYVDREYHSFMVDLKPTGKSHFEDVAEIDLKFDCDGLDDGKSYTIAELCGEEE